MEQSLYFLAYFAVFTVVFAICEIPFRRAHAQPAFNRHSLIDFAYGYVNQIFNVMALSGFVALVIHRGLKPRFPRRYNCCSPCSCSIFFNTGGIASAIVFCGNFMPAIIRRWSCAGPHISVFIPWSWW